MVDDLNSALVAEDMDVVDTLRSQFAQNRGFVVPGRWGRHLLVTDVSGLIGEPSVLVAYEGRGAMVWDMRRPLNAYRLISSGFPMTAAHEGSELLNRVFTQEAAKAAISPKGEEK